MSSPVRTAAPAWQVVLVLMVVVGVGHFNRLSISVAGTERLIPGDGISPQRMGFVYSGYLLLYTLAMLPGGWLIDRWGAKKAMLVVLIGSALYMTLTGLAGYAFSTALSLWVTLLLVRSLMGMINAPQHPAAARLVGSWIAPAGRNLANGLINFAACVGMSSTYILFGALIDHFDWMGACLIAGGQTLVLALIWTLLVANRPEAVKEENESAPAAVTGGVLQLLCNRSLLFLTFSYGALGYFQYLFFYWMEYYFEQISKLSKQDSRFFASALALTMGLGMVAGGWLSDKMRRRWRSRLAWSAVPVGGLLLAAVAVVVGVVSPIPALALSCFALAMAAAGTSEGSFWTLAVELGGRRGGTAAAILNTGGNAGGLIAPLLTPVLSAWLGWQIGFGIASIACLLAALSWVWIDPRAEEQEKDQIMTSEDFLEGK